MNILKGHEWKYIRKNGVNVDVEKERGKVLDVFKDELVLWSDESISNWVVEPERKKTLNNGHVWMK